ncbi:SurA N-terminal domain-containing protein [Paenibacillus eucommiae]|uniref:SurA N-terminal domain-containing protein n=1 Tax=Paenibacillus eucommiae TaxID=1355755 RepID=A0ABS4JAY8_9BACL|nr:SurA N-terminal domain-containing protein [Paenibacillus eucommiae]MBP1996975.1 hypothetical protein [Paenibacillus eucommiae]
MKKTKIISIILVLFLFVSVSVIYAGNNSNGKIKNFFDEIINKTDISKTDGEFIVAEIPDKNIHITRNQFVNLKANLEFMEKTSESDFNLTDEDIIKRLIIEELLVVHADELGLVVTDQDIEKEISNVKEALKSEPGDMVSIHENLVRKSGLDENSYWESAEIKEQYKRLVLSYKIIEYYAFQNSEAFDKLKNKLYQDASGNIRIN